MSIKIRKQPDASVATPPSTHLQFFVSDDGSPKLKDEFGNVTDAASSGQVTLNEQGSDPAAVANKVKLYSKDVAGISEFFARDDQGNVIQITSGGALNAAGNGTFFDDSQRASLNQTVLTSASFSWNTGINLGTLPTNGLFTIHVETQSVNSNGTRDFGFMRIASAWDTPPGLPAPLPNQLVDGWGLFNVLNQITGVSLNALGELLLDFTEIKGFDTQFLLKVTVSPVRALPFNPIVLP